MGNGRRHSTAQIHHQGMESQGVHHHMTDQGRGDPSGEGWQGVGPDPPRTPQQQFRIRRGRSSARLRCRSCGGDPWHGSGFGGRQ